MGVIADSGGPVRAWGGNQIDCNGLARRASVSAAVERTPGAPAALLINGWTTAGDEAPKHVGACLWPGCVGAGAAANNQRRGLPTFMLWAWHLHDWKHVRVLRYIYWWRLFAA